MPRVCGQCQAVFLATAAEVNRGGGRYCSQQCAHAPGKTRRRKGVTLTCVRCGTAFYRYPSDVRKAEARGHALAYCSHACQTLHQQTGHGHGRHGYRADLGHAVRSRWEANICRLLVFVGVPYRYEPHAFPIEGGTYIPDLWAAGLLIEIKGYSNARGMRKLAAFRRAYPAVPLVVIDEQTYAILEKAVGWSVPGWERGETFPYRAPGAAAP